MREFIDGKWRDVKKKYVQNRMTQGLVRVIKLNSDGTIKSDEVMTAREYKKGEGHSSRKLESA